MADIADMAQDQIDQEQERTLARARIPYSVPEGKRGDCDFCGEWSSRLIDGICAPCRDFHRLP